MRAHHLSMMVGVIGIVACSASGRGGRAAPPRVRPGIEVLLADSLHLVRQRRVGLLTNHTGIDAEGRRDVDLLRAAGVRVVALFSPEHGFRGTEDRPDLANALDSLTGLPIYSVYGATRAPDLRALDSLDVLLVDLQDVGARYYTYVSTAVLLMREAAARHVGVIALDRPNPVGGTLVQGNVRAAARGFTPFVGFLPIAMRHGMTLAELLRLANAELGIAAHLTVVPLAGWRRDQLFDATGLPWVRPSPNLPDLESALHYPGTCLFEGTNLSVGRGTPFAFQVIGAPWLDPAAVLRRLAEPGQGMGEGVVAGPVRFTPRGASDQKYDGVLLRGLRLRVTAPERYDPTRAAVALLAAISASHPRAFRFRDAWFDLLAAGPELRTALEAGTGPEAIVREFTGPLERFRQQRGKYLLY